jgi:16S rRNA (cytosine967-C5)-methyltransferase
VGPHGLLIYATCSLEPEEGAMQVAALLAARPDFGRLPIVAAEIGAEAEWITGQGDLRTLPFHLKKETPGLSGIDGFYAARLRRIS